MGDLYLKEGHIVWVDKPLAKFYQIQRKEPFDFVTGEEDTAIFSTVAPGAESGFKNISLLEPDDKPLHMLQALWGVEHLYPIKYYAKIPAGTNVFGIDDDKEIGFIDASKSPYYNPNPLFMFYLVTKWFPSFNCVNNGAVTIRPKIWFRGMKYDIADAPADLVALVRAGKLPHRRIYFGGVARTP